MGLDATVNWNLSHVCCYSSVQVGFACTGDSSHENKISFEKVTAQMQKDLRWSSFADVPFKIPHARWIRAWYKSYRT